MNGLIAYAFCTLSAMGGVYAWEAIGWKREWIGLVLGWGFGVIVTLCAFAGGRL